MSRKVTPFIVKALVRTGEKLPSGVVMRLHEAMGLVEVGSWLDQQSVGRPIVVKDREALFDLALPHLEQANAPLYLEFGVAAGVTLTYWSQNLRNAKARLVGFDSFEGLPHDWQAWQGAYPKGHFAQAQVPQIPDARIQYEVGWFEETLPTFQVPEHDALVVTMDADLYSSTALVLREIRQILTAGTLIYFDDFPMEEKSAVADFCSREGMRLEPVAMASNGFNWLFRVLP